MRVTAEKWVPSIVSKSGIGERIWRMERICGAGKMWHVWVCQLKEEMRTLGLDWVRNRCFSFAAACFLAQSQQSLDTSQFLLFWQFTKTQPCIRDCMNTRSLTSRECTKGRKKEKLEAKSTDEGMKMMVRTKAFGGWQGQSGLVCYRPRNGVSRFPPKTKRAVANLHNIQPSRFLLLSLP